MRSSLFLKLLFLLLSFNAEAKFKSIEEILVSPQRPTMTEVLPFLDDIHQERGIPVTAQQVSTYFDKRIDIPAWLRILLQTSPRMIATVEHLYPGAKWIFLGRDAMAISDVFEAYYHSIGEKDRVLRLGVSKASFNHLDERGLRKQFGAYFKQQGFTWEKADKLPPYIMIDAISGGYGRQGRSILAAMYMQGLSEGKNPLFMVDRLNMIGLRVSTYNHPFIYDTTQSDYFAKKEKWLWVLGNAIDYNHLFGFKGILTYQAESDHTHNEAGYTHFVGAWHDSYGAFSTTGVADVGDPYPLEMKKSILWTQKKIWEAVKTNTFANEVKKQKVTVAKYTKKMPTLTAKQIKDIEDLLSDLPEKDNSNNIFISLLHQAVSQRDSNFDLQELVAELNRAAPSKQYLIQLMGYLQDPYALDYFIRTLDRAMIDKKVSVKRGSTLDFFLKIHKLLDETSCESYLKETERR